MQKAVLLSLAVAAGLAPSSQAATHTVNMVGVTFSPASVTIDAGDTVQWVYPISIHTVTSGTGPLDPQVGLLFDHAGSAGLIFEYTFNDPGDFPYFCRPHFALGMIGNVTVNAPTATSEEVRTESWGKVKNSYRDAIGNEGAGTDED